MHMGTPSIISTGGSLPEIAGDAGLTFAPDDPAALAAAMRRLVSDRSARAALAVRAQERAPFYTWRRAAEQTVRVYEEALAAG
jgi:glycosyltransferase involved in cell wall biosynthesis